MNVIHLELASGRTRCGLRYMDVVDNRDRTTGTEEFVTCPTCNVVVVLRCLDCALPYSEFPLDVNLPRSQWLLICPDDRGVLCAACIVKRAARVPGCTVVHMVLEMSPK